jgi:hypothetical protein
MFRGCVINIILVYIAKGDERVAGTPASSILSRSRHVNTRTRNFFILNIYHTGGMIINQDHDMSTHSLLAFTFKYLYRTGGIIINQDHDMTHS